MSQQNNQNKPHSNSHHVHFSSSSALSTSSTSTSTSTSISTRQTYSHPSIRPPFTPTTKQRMPHSHSHSHSHSLSYSNRTKSWTEYDRAPEPFSSPTKPIIVAANKKYNGHGIGNVHVLNKNKASSSTPRPVEGEKKYGYNGNYLFQRSSSAGIILSTDYGKNNEGCGGNNAFGNRCIHHQQQQQQQQRRSSVDQHSGSSHGHGGNSGYLLQLQQRQRHQQRPSLTKSDFPLLLSPTKDKAAPTITTVSSSGRPGLQRKESYSTVVVGSSTPISDKLLQQPAAAGKEEDLLLLAGGVIPPLPLIEPMIDNEVEKKDGSSSSVVKQQVHVHVGDATIQVDERVDSQSSQEEEEGEQQQQSSRTSTIHWHPNNSRRQIQRQRQRAHSFHHFSTSSHSSPASPAHGGIIRSSAQLKAVTATATATYTSSSSSDSNNYFSHHHHHPFATTFTTTSISALHNDIGTVLARSNRVSEAMERYKLCVGNGLDVLQGLLLVQQQQTIENENDFVDNDFDGDSEKQLDKTTTKGTLATTTVSAIMRKKCPKVTEAEGLAWFRQKLLRGDIMIPGAVPLPQQAEDKSMNEDMGRSTIDGSSCFAPTTSSTSNAQGEEVRVSFSSPPPPQQLTPFQPAGFGGCASPRRMRSASFSVSNLLVPPTANSGTTTGGQQHSTAIPLMEDPSWSFEESPTANTTTTQQYYTPPKSPVRTRPQILSFGTTRRTISAPLTAPHPGKPTLMIPKSSSSILQPPRLFSRTLSRTYSHGSATTSKFQQTHHHHAHHHHHGAMDDIVHDIHQHQKLDCPTNETGVYSCNGTTPLGMEYICDPLPVLGSSLRKLLVAVSSSYSSSSSAVLPIIMEYAAVITARINLASLEYRAAGGGISDKLSDVLGILELALEDCQKVVGSIAGEEQEEKKNDKRMKKNKQQQFRAWFNLLKAVIYSNIGTVKYRLKRVRESMASFEMARDALLENNNEEPGNDPYLGTVDFDDDEEDVDDYYNNPGGSQQQHPQPHDDNRFPPKSYLLLVIRLNLSQVSLRLNKLDEATDFSKLIAEDNKPHRRQSSRRSLLHQHTGHSFRRSSSFSATTSALQTAVAAYEHDIDRRSKWLCSVSEHYITALIYEAKGESSDYKEAWHHYNRLLSLARVKLDHRHPYICALLERRGAVLFEQRKLQCSMLSYLACLKILEHQQSCAQSNVFNMADLSRVQYAVARVLHDKEEYHDAIHMYQRALVCQRALASESGRPATLDVITTLCNISRVHHLSGEIDEALVTNKEVLKLALILVGGKSEHPFLVHRLKIEGNILVEAGRLEDAIRTFVDAARRCGDDGRDQLPLGGGNGSGGGSSSQEDANSSDCSVLSTRSAAALSQVTFFHPSAASA